MARLGIMDAAFLQIESRNTPAHIAGLQIFEPPKDYDGDWLHDLIEAFEKGGPVVPPFNQRLKKPNWRELNPLPEWEEDPEFDLDYHVRYAALPRPGTMQQLFTLVERLHSRQIDQTRPLWEMYCIEGLEDGRLALYFKVHHSVVDGVSGMKLMESTLSKDKNAPLPKAPWQTDLRKPRDPDVAPPAAAELIDGISSMMRTQLGTLKEIGNEFLKMGKQFAGVEEGHLGVPFTAPKTPFNVNVTPHRRFAVGTIALSELRALGTELDGTINDVVLTLCSTALRNYLKHHNILPDRPLITACPVSIRPKDADAGGNQITVIMVDLATHIPDILQRYQQIKLSADEAKSGVAEMSKEARWNYAVFNNSLNILMLPFNRMGVMPPAMNLVVSNVPGPREPLYMFGGKLTNNYPVSLLMDGQGLNITVTSYEDKMDFGLLADRKAMPDLSYLAQLIEEAFAELKEAAALYSPAKDEADDVQREAAE